VGRVAPRPGAWEDPLAEPPSLRFDDIAVGQTFAPYAYDITAELARRYAEVADGEPTGYPAALGTTLAPPLLLDTLHALKAVLAFPEGVVHAREEVELRAPGRVGDRITIHLRVLGRYVKGERRFVVFEQRAENQRGETLAVARKTFVWPA
jgi:acyl dehydratase